MTDPEKSPLSEELNENPEQVAAQPSAADEVCEVIVEPTADESVKTLHEMSKPELIAELKRIVDAGEVNAHKEVAAIRQALFVTRQREVNAELEAFVAEGNDPLTFVSSADPDEDAVKQLMNAFRDARAAYLEAEEARKAENLRKKQEAVDAIKALADDIDNVNMHFPRFQELQTAFKEAGDVAQEAETEIWRNYQREVERFYDSLNMNKELRALDFKKNLEVKRRLIEESKSLGEAEDVIEALRSLRELHNQWRETGPVAKELRDEIWEEFRAASAVVNKRHQDYFEERKAREKESEDAKTALCERVEAIDFSDVKGYAQWEELAEQVKALQEEWKKTGFASRKVNNALYARFRGRCDEFFKAKFEYSKKTRDELQQNLRLKTALCERAEALAEPENIGKAAEEVRKLQEDWRKIGGVGKKYSDAIWQRFQTACNHVYDLRKEEQSGRRAEENANLEKKNALIERLRALKEKGAEENVLPEVRKIQDEWKEIGRVPFRKKDKVYADYRELLDTIYESAHASRSNERKRNYRSQIADMKEDDSKLGRERQRLTRLLEQRRQDLLTYENNLGFFNVKSSAGNSMVKDMERKMQRLKEEISEIQQKISMLDEEA